MNKTVMIAVAILSGMGAWAAHGEDEIESFVGIADRISVPDRTVVEITHVDLGPGIWTIDGSLQAFTAGMNYSGCVAIGGNISRRVELSWDGTTAFQTACTAEYFVNLGLTNRTFDLDHNVRIYLVAYSQINNQSPAVTQVWGFISARKIRNHD